MGMFLKDSLGTFRSIPKIFLKNSDGTWRGVVSAYLKDSLGTWRLFFGAEYLNPSVLFEPALVSNDSIGRFKQGSTLSLDRGVWDGSPTSYSLTIQGTLDSGATWIDFATGSGTSVTYLLNISDVMYPSYSFRGKVVATNTYGSTTFYTLITPSILSLQINGIVSLPTQNGATFSWTVNPSTSGYRASQRIEFYSVSNPSVTPVYTYNVPTNSANSAVVSNAALTTSTQYNAVIKIVSLDSSNTVNFSSDILFTTASSLVNTVAPSITGTKQEGQTVTANPGTWSGNGTITYAYQWQYAVQGAGSNYAYYDIPGATGSTYFIPYNYNETYVDKGIRLKVTATTVDTPGGVIAYSQDYAVVDFAVPVGTDDTVTFSRDSSSNYNFSITNTGTWTGTPTSYRYQWYTYESTFGGNYSWFPVSGATSSTFNASGVKLFEIMPIVWASNAGGESDTGYSLTNTNGTRPAGNIGSISAAATQVVKYTAPIIGSFSVTGGAGSITYSYSVTGDDPTKTLAISYSGAATGSFTPAASGSTQTGLAAGTYNFVLTATNSVSGNSYFVTSTVANVVVTAPLTAPVNTLAPAVTPVTGTAGVTTYTTTNGTWTGNPTPTFTYQWQYNDQGSLWASITGATSSTYSPPSDYFATRVSPIRCRVTATNSQAPSGVAATSNEVVVSRPVYVVTYDYQSATGGNGTASVNVTQGNSTSLPTPTRTNYTFGGWYTAITGGTFIGNGGFAYTPTASITLYARWAAINWTVSWDANGGTVSPTSNTGIQGSTVTAPTPTRTNFTFLYWRDSLSAVSYLNQLSAGGTWTQSQTITFYAWWQQITYVVTYNANSGTVSPASATVNAGSATTLPTPTRSGFTFNGWYTAASGGTLVGAAGGSYTPTAAITLYAQWTAVVVNYTMTWRANGGSSGDQTTGPFASGSAHTAPSPGTRTGYTFAGYYDTASLDFTVGPIASGGTYTPTANTTLQARWTAIVPSITQIVVSGNVTAGVTCAVTGTNMGSIQYTFYARDTGTSAWTQISAGTAAPSSATSASISTTGSVGTLPDQYYVDMQPFFGARSTSGANGGTGTAGTLRSTSGSPKNNQSGSVTVNF